MKIDILTIFPSMFSGPFSESILGRAQESGLVTITIHDLRDWSQDKHKSVDDRPYGGGPGMVMRVDVIDTAISNLESRISKQYPKNKTPNIKKILLSAKGERYTQQKAVSFTGFKHLILVCGHYEGVDHRAYELVDEVISVGDYVLTGGEIPAMTLVDSVVRLLPGVLGDAASLMEESHTRPGLVEYPHYTRPEEYTPKSVSGKKGKKVPEVLLSGDHRKIEEWRKENSG